MLASDNCIFLCCFLLMFVVIPMKIHRSDEVEYENYLKTYNKSYGSREEYTRHFEAYRDNLEAIKRFNALRNSNSSAVYGLTPHSDVFPLDFINQYLRLNIRHKSDNDQKYALQLQDILNTKQALNLPQRVDWRKNGVITDINDQKLCGGCWAFTVIENVEAMYALKFGNLTELSVQQMIDCAQYNNGCNGGDMCRLLRWLIERNIPIQRANEYPLTFQTGECKLNRSFEGVRIANFICRNFAHQETKILSMLANHGPVIAAINALTWQNYLGGVIQYHCDESTNLLNHAVQIVGYDLSADIPYYIVRNSWGKDFGDEGYLYISIGNNTCGIANEVIVLNVK